MPHALPAPEVLHCYFDESFDPHLPAMCLRWQPEDTPPGRRWELPEGVCLFGPAPRRFGVSIQRQDHDAYSVRLLWDRTCLNWLSLSRAQLLTSSLAPLLHALGTALWYLLEQPVPPGDGGGRRRAA